MQFAKQAVCAMYFEKKKKKNQFYKQKMREQNT